MAFYHTTTTTLHKTSTRLKSGGSGLLMAYARVCQSKDTGSRPRLTGIMPCLTRVMGGNLKSNGDMLITLTLGY